jgi:hypothetical protein
MLIDSQDLVGARSSILSLLAKLAHDAEGEDDVERRYAGSTAGDLSLRFHYRHATLLQAARELRDEGMISAAAAGYIILGIFNAPNCTPLLRDGATEALEADIEIAEDDDGPLGEMALKEQLMEIWQGSVARYLEGIGEPELARAARQDLWENLDECRDALVLERKTPKQRRGRIRVS